MIEAVITSLLLTPQSQTRAVFICPVNGLSKPLIEFFKILPVSKVTVAQRSNWWDGYCMNIHWDEWIVYDTDYDIKLTSIVVGVCKCIHRRLFLSTNFCYFLFASSPVQSNRALLCWQWRILCHKMWASAFYVWLQLQPPKPYRGLKNFFHSKNKAYSIS